MKEFSIYEISTGKIISSGFSNVEGLQEIPTGCAVINVQTNPLTNYIKNGIVKTIPDKPNNNYVFDFVNEQFVEDEFLLIQDIKLKRNLLLQSCDWTQLPDVDENIRLKYQKYRQALRDITLQEGFPQTTIFPELE